MKTTTIPTKELEALRSELEHAKIWLSNQQDLKESIISIMEGQKIANPTRNVHREFNNGIESAISVTQDSMYKKMTLSAQLLDVRQELEQMTVQNESNRHYRALLFKEVGELREQISNS